MRSYVSIIMLVCFLARRSSAWTQSSIAASGNRAALQSRSFSSTNVLGSTSSSEAAAASTTEEKEEDAPPKVKQLDFKYSMDDIVSLCKRRGIIFPSSEIYNGYAGFYDYGPLGCELKKNVKDAWWNNFVQSREDVVGVDTSIIHNPTTWKSSGMFVAVAIAIAVYNVDLII